MKDDLPKRSPGRPRTVNRERAVRVAMEAYWTDGVLTLSLNEVCRRSGLSKPALYRDFGGEDGLMAAALEHYDRHVVQPVLDAMTADLPFPEFLELLVVGMTTASGPAGCLFTEMRFARSHLGASTLTRIDAMEQRRLAAFRECIERAVEAGQASAIVSPEVAARYLDTQIAMVLLQLGAGQPAHRVAEQARLAFRVLVE